MNAVLSERQPVDTSAWLAERRKGIGASDAAAVVGLSKWRTPLQVYYEKIGEAPGVTETEAMKWGKLLEPIVRQEYAEQTGRKILMPDTPYGILRHPDSPFMLVTLDGFTDDNRLLEIKTARHAGDWGEEGSDQVPTDYLLQVQHGMYVAGFDVADIAVLIGGSEFRIYEVPADKELQEMLLEREAEFWKRVESEEPPDAISVADLMQYVKARAGNITATTEILDVLNELKSAKTAGDFSKQRQEILGDKIKTFMGEKTTLVDSFGNPLATWNPSKGRSSFNVDQFKIDHPDLYKKYATVGSPGRRFLLK